MLVRRYQQVVIAPSLLTSGTLTLANLPGQTVNVPLDTSDPIEEIYVIMQATVKTSMINNVVATAQVADGMLNTIKRVRLGVVEPGGPRTPVDCSGPALLELSAAEAENLDPATRGAISMAQSTQVLANTIVRATYRITVPHPRFTDMLRLRTCLPAHLYDQPPVLQIDVGGAADISGIADPYSALAIEVVVIRRQMTREWSDLINKQSNGNPWAWFIPSDVVESTTALAVSQTSVETRLRVLAPGQISSILMRFFKGQHTTWSPTTRRTLDDSTTIGQETIWEIQQGQTAIEKFRLKHKAIENGFARPDSLPYFYNAWQVMPSTTLAATGLTVTATPTLGAAAAPNDIAGSSIPGSDLGIGIDEASAALVPKPLVPDNGSLFLNFAGAPGREIYETGSFLDVTTPMNRQQITEIVGRITTPASAGNAIKLVTRRFYDAINQVAML